MKVKSYCCKTYEDAEKLFQYYKKKRFGWRGGTDLDTIYSYSPERRYNFHIEDKLVTHSDLNTAKDLGFEILDHIPVDSICPEFEQEFKKLFRLNRIPETLTESQINKMKELKVDKSWMIQQ